ncbi:putative N-acetyltransferase p20 [Cytospora mali]|uniref:N-acetyltransferase p20 n=1 Tax=Cytospora mali TaxID=578113 RepID=A0A194VBL8_CYTMA|nr:putative N-acetyltransferase p20 [Valsa mali var. pyri (nom. inval.)]
MVSQTPAAAASGYTITSPRLTIRTAVPSDGEALVSFFTDPANFPWEAETDLTVEKVLPRIDRWAKATEEWKSAFVVVIERESDQLIGFGGFNSLPYTKPLGSESIWTVAKQDGPEGGMVLVADIGMSIDHRYQRRGYAREAVCALVEYGFGTLGCVYVHMDTAKDNEPFRALMRDMGIGEVEGDGGEAPEGAAFCFASKSYNYVFERADWERVKDEMKKKSKWPL